MHPTLASLLLASRGKQRLDYKKLFCGSGVGVGKGNQEDVAFSPCIPRMLLARDLREEGTAQPSHKVFLLCIPENLSLNYA